MTRVLAETDFETDHREARIRALSRLTHACFLVLVEVAHLDVQASVDAEGESGSA